MFDTFDVPQHQHQFIGESYASQCNHNHTFSMSLARTRYVVIAKWWDSGIARFGTRTTPAKGTGKD